MSPFADGTPLVSQWPIPPLHFFDYEMNVLPSMAGTYFYHSHVGFQAVSCSGPLIVEDSRHQTPPYEYYDDRILFVQDAFVKNETAIEAGLVASPLSWSGEAAAILVNGKGGGSVNGTACNASLSTIDVEPGKTYRLRFIGATALTFASIAIEGHDGLQVIEADGSYTLPQNTSFLQLAAGQRYSVLFTTKLNPEKQQYYIQLESRERPTVTRSYAILNYISPSSSPVLYPPPDASKPLTLPNTTLGFLDYQLKPHPSCFSSDKDKMPTAAEVTRTVVMTVHQSVNGQTIWLQNGKPWTESFPVEPYLISLYKSDGIEFPSLDRAMQNHGLDNLTRTFPAALGEVLEIVIQNTGADSGGLDAHPFHAHGAHYWDLGSGNGTYDAAANEAKMQVLGANPVKRDTTVLYRYAATTGKGVEMGWRAWRIRVSQPGAWMVHCHILQHMLMGMQSVWVMGNSSQVLGVGGEEDLQGYLVYGGSVVGNETVGPRVVHWFDGEGEGEGEGDAKRDARFGIDS